MHTITECEVFVGVTADVEPERVVENLLVPVSGHIGEIHRLSFCDGHAPHCGVLGGGAHEFLDRGGPPDHLLHRGRHQVRVLPQSGQFAGVLDESVQSAGDQIGPASTRLTYASGCVWCGWVCSWWAP